MEPSTAMTGGPKRIAPRPVPVGCEQLPVTDGNFRAERTNTKAPEVPRRARVEGCSLTIRLSDRAPPIMKGSEAAHHPAAWATGKYPSIMCMNYLSDAEAGVFRVRRDGTFFT